MWYFNHQLKVLFLWLLSLFFHVGVAIAQNPKSHTISGYVTDGKSQ